MRGTVIKKIIVYMSLFFCSACIMSCGSKEKKETESESESIETNVNCKEFTGEGGYIVEAQVWDYSGRFETVFQWTEGVRMPFDKIEDSLVVFEKDENQIEEVSNFTVLYMKDYTENNLNKYIQMFRDDGYSVWESETSINMYKDGIIVYLVIANDRIYPYIYTGNVMVDRAVTVSEARDLIESNQLLKDDTYFSEYCVIPIENHSLVKKGYYEFVIVSVRNDEALYNMPYYMITDGKNIIFFEQDIFTNYDPASAHLVDDELVITRVEHRPDGEAGQICRYTLRDGIFEKSAEDISVAGEVFVGKYEDNEVKIYSMKYNTEAEFPLERKDLWIIDEEYNIDNATLK